MWYSKGIIQLLGIMMKSYVFAAALAMFGSPLLAGPQFVDTNEFAVSGYDVVAYRSLEQSPVGQSQPAAVPGRADITTEYNGAVFAFASEENRETFLSDPAHFAPQYDGHCAYGVAQGGKVPGNPNLWRIVNDKLYLNITQNVVGFWEEDISGNLVKSENNWVSIEPKAASTIAIPGFETPAPIN